MVGRPNQDAHDECDAPIALIIESEGKADLLMRSLRSPPKR
jgi:hypothetical protein